MADEAVLAGSDDEIDDVMFMATMDADADAEQEEENAAPAPVPVQRTLQRMQQRTRQRTPPRAKGQQPHAQRDQRGPAPVPAPPAARVRQTTRPPPPAAAAPMEGVLDLGELPLRAPRGPALKVRSGQSVHSA